MGMAENSAANQRRRGPGRPFQPGQSGNPAGKPLGARHRATQAAEALLDGESEALTRKAIELALAGDGTALRLCLDRIIPPRRERPLLLELPPVASPADAVGAMSAILAAAARGDLTPGQVGELSGLIANIIKAFEAMDLDRRIRALEQDAREK
jgi:Family of unknown function (DUF5681)